MKKLLVLIIALVLTLSLAACGGENTPNSSQSSSVEPSNISAASETEFAHMTFGHITMSVPSVFSACTEKEGMYVSAGPDASIVVTPILEIDIKPSEWDESLAEEALETIYGSTYTELKLSAFKGNVDMNGNTAVYYAFNGKNANGKDRLVQVVRLYNADLTAQYMVTLMHSADNKFFTSEVSGKIINSITMAPDAQKLAAEPEG